jgi:hypothetical protein
LNQKEVKKELRYQAGTAKNIFALDESKARMSDETNTSNPFEIHPFKTNTNQISLLNGRVQGWFLC